MAIPPIFPVRQIVNQPQVANVAAEIARQIQGSKLPRRLPRGAKVAVAVGSRGIANIATMARAAVDTLRDMGYAPFILAAMGSHGGATPEGQRELLASYGVTEQAMRVPVKTDMDVVQLGVNSWNEPVYWDKNAFNSDGVVTISRIKPHTDFHGKYESGIVKMLVIGLGKRIGAATHHQYGVRGLRDMIPETGKVILEKGKFALGLGVLENANDQTALIHAVEPEELLQTEPKLLDQARTLMPRIPFDELDLLVIGELGKNYSGTGLDVNIIGRQMVEGEPDIIKPKITRICLLDLSEESHGNATGIGIADLITVKLLNKMNAEVSHINSLTACFLLRSKVPIELPTDRACIEMGLKTCWQPRLEKVRMAIIPNTLELTHLWVSEPLAKPQANVVVEGDARPVPFAADESLLQETLFPHSTRGRRHSKSAH